MAEDPVVGGLTGECHIVVAVLDGGGAAGEDTAGAAHDAGYEAAAAGNGLTGDAEVFDGRTVALAEQAGVVGAGVGIVARIFQIQALNVVILAVEGAAEAALVGIIANGRPRRIRIADAAEIDAFDQTGVQLSLAAVDLVGEPLQLGGGGDLVIAVLRLRGLVHIGDRDGALRREGAVQRGNGDDRLALGQCGHQTRAVHSGHGGRAAAPGHFLVFGSFRQHSGCQLGGLSAVEGQFVSVQRHAGDSYGVIPAAGLGVLARNEVKAVEILVVIV